MFLLTKLIFFFNLVGYTTDTLEFLWNENDPVIKKEDLRIPKYSLGEITTSRCDKTYVKGNCLLQYCRENPYTYLSIMEVTSENIPLDIRAQRRMRSACACAQSDQNLHWAHFG